MGTPLFVPNSSAPLREWVEGLRAAAERVGLGRDVMPIRGWLGGPVPVACFRRLGSTDSHRAAGISVIASSMPPLLWLPASGIARCEAASQLPWATTASAMPARPTGFASPTPPSPPT